MVEREPPSSTRLTTASAVMPLSPLAVANCVSACWDLAAASREPVALLDDDLVAAVDPDDAREIVRGGERVELAVSSAVMAGRYRRACGKLPPMVPEAPLETHRARARSVRRGLVCPERARRRAGIALRGPKRVLRPRRRAGLPAGRHQRSGTRAWSGHGDVPLGGRPGLLPRRLRRSPAHRRGRGAPATTMGLLPLRERDQAHDRRSRRRTRRHRRGRCASEPGRPRAGVGTRSTRWRSATGVGVERETNDARSEAYAAVRAKYGTRAPTPYRDGWLPG